MANTDIVTREDIGNGLAINANKLEADFTKVASKNDLLTKADLVNGKVPASQLPSFIDEIQEFPSIASFPITGQSDILYLALDTNKLYRWSGTAYVDLSALAGMPDFALNANVVHKTLDETIDGIKSFNSPIYAQDGVSLKNNNAPLLQTGRTILYANASQFGFLNGNDKGAIFMYNNPNSLVYVLPNQTGTLALLSDLAPFLTISTAQSTYQTLANLSSDLTASASKYPSVNAVNAGLATKYNNPTGTVSQYVRGDGSIANFPFIPTLEWGNIGGTLSNQTDLQSALNGKYNNPTGTTSQYVRGDGSIATFPAPYGLLPTGGEAGQILSKVDGTDYNATWIDNYALWTSVIRHEVKAGEAINKGQAVYISPIQDGTNMIVIKADYSQESTSSKTLGLLMQNLSNNGFGQVVTEGLLGGLNTIGANQGDPVWLGANGSLIYGLGNKPEAPNHLVFIGIVTRVNANNGEIFVKVQNGFELNELHNVKILNQANNQVLAYEQSSGLWKNKAVNDLIGYVPANDNLVAHLSGNETIDGNKTFSGATAIAGLFIDETFGYANIATHTQLKAHADYFHFNASENNKGAKFIYGSAGQRIYSLPITDGILALTSDIPTLGSLGGVPATRTISINGTTYDLSANRAWNLSASEIATALGYTPLAVESDPIFVASPAYGISALQISNWNTAYGWGNHAGLYSLLGHTHSFASLTAKPTTLSGYGITDGATSAQGANADTAFGWGNHALVGYLLASTASTLYQSKDADLTAIAGLAGATGLLRKTALDTWALDTNAYLTGITSAQVTGALGYTPVPNTRTITINGTAYDLSADRAWTIASGVTSFNTRTGAITLISADVTGALGFTPYNASNPSGYISGITSGMVTTALGYTPYNSSNPSGYISGITSGMVTTALGYTPYNSSNPAGYVTSSGSVNYASSAGNADTVDGYHASGFWIAEGGWKPSSLSGATRLIGKTSPDGGEFGLAYSGGQIHPYADGFFYQNEGAYRVWDSTEVGNSHTWTGGQNNFLGNGNTGSTNNVGLVVYSTGGNGAQMSFHRSGAYAINMGLDSDNVFRIGGWSAGANRLQLDMSGNLTVAGSMNASYFYGSGSIRCGDMWGGAGLYRPSGSMVFGIENSDWIFSKGAVTQAYFAGGDGNLWMRWAGDWLSNLLGAKATHRGEGSNYVDYSRYVYNNGAYSGSGWIEPSDLGVRYANSANRCNYLDTQYVGGSQGNPQVYFNNGIGLKVAMTGAWSVWSDTLWINGYSGGDVPWMCALHFLRNSEPRFAISAQTQGSGGYGSYYEVITTYNIANQSVSYANSAGSVAWGNVSGKPGNLTYWDTWYGSAYLGSNGDLYMGWAGAWTSSWFNQNVKTNAGPTFDTVYLNNWCRVRYETGIYFESYDAGLRSAYQASFGQVASYGTARSGYGGFVTVNNYITNLMQNTSGDFGFFSNSDWAWRLFYNRGNDCWGIGTDNTYSGDGFRCIKYGSAQYGWTTWSDRRAKENISSITGALDKVLGMRGVYYNYIKDEAKSQHIGFIAQELIDILPQSVRYAEEIDEYNINYGPIVSVLAEAIKEQQVQIAELKLLVNQLINR